MTSDEKIKWVRDRVCGLEELGGLGIWSYPLEPVMREVAEDISELFVDFFTIEKEAATGKKQRQQVVAITIDEQVDILKRLEGQQLIKIIEVQKDKVFLEVFPKHPSPIKLRTLEHIARRLSDKFTGAEITDTLLDYGIPRSDISYPNTKWRTLLETFSALATSPNPEQREKFGGAITTFLHPLNFGADEGMSHELIEDFNKYLKYDGYEITLADDGEGYKLATTTNKTKVAPPIKPRTEPKNTSTDYIADAINFFKNEYNKVRKPGLTYEYPLGDNFSLSNFEPEPDEINYAHERRKAVERLKEVGFVKSFEIEERVIDDYGNVFDYAICKIDESQITQQKEAPYATDVGVHELTQKVIHEHTHRFENSIQEKGIDLNHKFESSKKDGLYITKDGDDFSYKGRFLKLSKTSDYYKVFSALYAKLPSGGEISYKDLITEVKSRLPEKEKVLYDEMKKFIQRNLTDKSNGFVRYADIPETEDNGRSLIYVNRGSGIVFNNQAG